MTHTSSEASLTSTDRVRSAATTALAVLAAAVVGLHAAPAHAASVRYVAPSGSDSADGSASHPYKTLTKAFSTLRAGDTLYVRGGTYPERIKSTPADGTASSPITVKAYPGERPVVQGLLWLSTPDYWTLDGVNVTWSSANSASEHMVKMTGGTGWRLTNAEIWGAHSYAAILVAGTPSGWRLDHLDVHDTYKSNDVNQDHLVYVNGGTGGGTIERCLFARSENGRGIKIGPPSGSSAAIGNVTIRYNTFYDNLGPSNIQLSYGASNNRIYRNIMVRPKSTSTSNVTAYNLNGTGNSAWENIGYLGGSVLDKSAGLKDAGGNIKLDPKFDNLQTLRPQDATASGYGRYAPGDAG
jgi:hypothetical protein